MPEKVIVLDPKLDLNDLIAFREQVKKGEIDELGAITYMEKAILRFEELLDTFLFGKEDDQLSEAVKGLSTTDKLKMFREVIMQLRNIDYSKDVTKDIDNLKSAAVKLGVGSGLYTVAQYIWEQSVNAGLLDGTFDADNFINAMIQNPKEALMKSVPPVLIMFYAMYKWVVNNNKRLKLRRPFPEGSPQETLLRLARRVFENNWGREQLEFLIALNVSIIDFAKNYPELRRKFNLPDIEEIHD